MILCLDGLCLDSRGGDPEVSQPIDMGGKQGIQVEVSFLAMQPVIEVRLQGNGIPAHRPGEPPRLVEEAGASAASAARWSRSSSPQPRAPPRRALATDHRGCTQPCCPQIQVRSPFV